MTKHHLFFKLLGCSLLLALVEVRPSFALAAASPKPTRQAPSPAALARAQTSAWLEGKLRQRLTIPAYPTERLLNWMEERHAAAREGDIVYRVLGEHLLISQKLLASKSAEVRRSGLLIASESANFTSARLPQEKTLLSLIYQGFLLPYVSLAYPNARRDPSRQRLIEAAVSVFGAAGERDKQISLLEWLLKPASTTQAKPDKITGSADAMVVDQNTQDWARGTLASILTLPKDASHADLERALDLLKAIESENMSGFAHLRVELEKRLEDDGTQDTSSHNNNK